MSKIEESCGIIKNIKIGDYIVSICFKKPIYNIQNKEVTNNTINLDEIDRLVNDAFKECIYSYNR